MKKENQQISYVIDKACIACGACKVVCPKHCISKGLPHVINQEQCIRCGKCVTRCWRNLIKRQSLK
ncbi:DUF362 domain-containing protein [Cellulosilyticum lentocellum]|uniref:DUF362 domain-containing protein n=1 Tax=Cellulosilyticum lentocellum TaxID=29360 RepID=UPI0012FF1CCA|nr:4Fe-4S binding protein [Cellulosilyticum lentocellum]